MNMTSHHDLDCMAELIADCRWSQITDPNNRARIVELVQQAGANASLAQLEEVVKKLEEIDQSLRPLMDWFARSDFYRT
jgi:hypothetical protein